jgi:hypothetical protein
MSLNLDLKLNGGRLSSFPNRNIFWALSQASNLRAQNIKVEAAVESGNVVREPSLFLFNDVLYWAYAARLSCIVALLPMVFFTKNDLTVSRFAACLHLLLTPITSFFLLSFSYKRCQQRRTKLISCALSGVCFILGNSASVILLANDDGRLAWVNVLLSMALCLGSVQLLMVLHKGNVIRVMACTAAAVMVVVLAILGSAAPQHMAKRFFQSASFPFLLLFLETSRLRPPPEQKQIVVGVQ